MDVKEKPGIEMFRQERTEMPKEENQLFETF